MIFYQLLFQEPAFRFMRVIQNYSASGSIRPLVMAGGRKGAALVRTPFQSNTFRTGILAFSFCVFAYVCLCAMLCINAHTCLIEMYVTKGFNV